MPIKRQPNRPNGGRPNGAISPAKVVPIRDITERDVLDVVIKVRKFMATSESAAFSLYADFNSLAPGLGDEAVKARQYLEAAVLNASKFLRSIEATAAYAKIKAEDSDPEQGSPSNGAQF